MSLFGTDVFLGMSLFGTTEDCEESCSDVAMELTSMTLCCEGVREETEESSYPARPL